MNKILIIAAHPDDEVLGCGGTIARLNREGKEVHLLVLSDGEGSRNGLVNDRQLALKKSCEILNIKKYEQSQFEDNAFDIVGILKIAKVVEEVIRSFRPDTIFTHFPHDMNQDHRVLCEATVVASRIQSMNFVKNLYYYEVSSSTECGSDQVFKPTLYIELSSEDVAKKEQALLAYEKELHVFPHPRSLKAISAKLMVRGSESGFSYAEAFQVRFSRL